MRWVRGYILTHCAHAQMLWGKRPFGEGCSQERILREEIMLHAKTVTFPAKPSVSAEAKEFIQG